MENNRQYKLRSQRQSTFQVPVQIETSENQRFLTNLLKSGDNSKNLVRSRESDISDLDCLGLLNVSDDSDDTGDKKLDPVFEQSSCVGEQQATSSCSAMGNAQDLINREILPKITSHWQKMG